MFLPSYHPSNYQTFIWVGWDSPSNQCKIFGILLFFLQCSVWGGRQWMKAKSTMVGNWLSLVVDVLDFTNFARSRPKCCMHAPFDYMLPQLQYYLGSCFHVFCLELDICDIRWGNALRRPWKIISNDVTPLLRWSTIDLMNQLCKTEASPNHH